MTKCPHCKQDFDEVECGYCPYCGKWPEDEKEEAYNTSLE